VGGDKRPWWIGPLAVAFAVFMIYNWPGGSADFVGSLFGRGVTFLEDLGPDRESGDATSGVGVSVGDCQPMDLRCYDTTVRDVTDPHIVTLDETG